jgi:hypothetical protein
VAKLAAFPDDHLKVAACAVCALNESRLGISIVADNPGPILGQHTIVVVPPVVNELTALLDDRLEVTLGSEVALDQ